MLFPSLEIRHSASVMKVKEYSLYSTAKISYRANGRHLCYIRSIG